MYTTNEDHMIYGSVPEIYSVTDRNFCHFGPFLKMRLLIEMLILKITKKTKPCEKP